MSSYRWPSVGGGGGGGLTIGAAITGGTAARLLYEDSGNLLAESGNLTFDGTVLNAAVLSNFGNKLQLRGESAGYQLALGSGQGSLPALGYNALGAGDGAIGFYNLGGGKGIVYLNGELSSANRGWIGATRTASPLSDYSFEGLLLRSGGILIGSVAALGATVSLPNYELDIRGGADDAIAQFTNDTTGNASSDGTKAGIDSSGNFQINQQESLSINLFTSGTAAWSIDSSQILNNKQSGNESTGAGTALLGSNSPAATLSAPYTWIKLKTSDGSTVYLPVWK